MPVRTVATDKDAYVDKGSPDTAFGGALSLYVRWQSSVLGGNHRETLVGFDLASVFDDPDVLEILAATLELRTVQAPEDQTLEAYEIPPGDWSEDQVTWNNKPTAGTLQDTEPSGDQPNAFNVIDAVRAAFDGDAQDRVGFLLQLQEGLAGEEHTVEYDSRESGGDEAEVKLQTQEQRRSDLDSQVTASKSGTGDLDSFVEVVFFHDRWQGGREDALVDADGKAYTLADLAWDPGLAQFWTTETFAGAIVRRHDRDGSHDATFEVHEDGSQLDDDVLGVAVDDEGNVFVSLSDDANTVVECTVDEANEVLTVQQRNTAHDVTPDWLTFDGTRVWLLEFFDGDVEERHPSNWALKRSGSVGSGDTFRGIARAPDHHELVLWDDEEGALETQDPDDLGTTQDAYDRSDIVTTGQGLALRGRSWFGSLFVGDSGDTGSDVWTFAAREIEAQVLVPTEGDEDLSSQVQPGSISGTADLGSQVAVGSSADLSTQVTPRVDGHADLESAVTPANLDGSADLDSIVEVQAVPIEDDHMGRAVGRVAPTVDVSEDDMRAVSGEVGTAVTVNPDGDKRDLRRVVHLLDGEEPYPRARADPATRLHRGDAVLYAQTGDAFAVGETIEWQGRRWTVLGLLGWEMVGDSRLYQEVGLRRLATVHEARAIGTVQREDVADLYSEVEVPDTA